MGRPLNKKYFGNRNVGVSSPTDDGIGGEGVASVTLNALGSYTTRPTVTFSAPTIANGVTATGTVTSEALSATVSAGGSGYAVGDLLDVTTAGGAAVAYVATVDGSGVIQTVNFTGTGASRGSFTSLGTVTTAKKTSTAGTGTLTLVVTWRAKAVAITLSGSGYVTAPTATFTQSVTASAVTLTTDSGAVGSSTNRENAILAWAYIGSSLVEVDIQKQQSTKRYKVNKSGDVSHTGARLARIKYTGIADGTAGYTAAQGVELNIVAQDSDGGTYLVRKLWNKTCILYPLAINNSTIGVTNNTAGTQFASGVKVKWTLGAATANQTVQILNA